MNVLDIVILLLFVPGLIRGLTKGFIEQAVTLAGIVTAVWMAYHYWAAVSEKLKTWIHMPDTAVNVVSFILVLLCILLIVMVVSKLLTGVTKMANLNWVNRLLGFAISIVISATVISILIILFDTVNLKFELVNSPILQESVLYGALRDLGYAVFPYLKGLIGQAQDVAATVV